MSVMTDKKLGNTKGRYLLVKSSGQIVARSASLEKYREA